MYIKGLSLEQLLKIAAQTGVRIDRNISGQDKGKNLCLRLRPDRGKYQRLSQENYYFSRKPRKIAALCWHGFKKFFELCFELNRDAVIKTSKATYKGYDDFLEKYIDTFEGTAFDNKQHDMLQPYGEACTCNVDVE